MLYPLSYGGSSAWADRGVPVEVSGRAGRPRPRRSRMTTVVPVVVLLVELVVLLAVLGLLLYGLGVWSTGPAVPPGAARQQLAGRSRAQLADAVARARWSPAHEEVGGETRVLLRRSYPGPDGLPVVLEDRLYTAFSATDPAWEARFTEAMSGARFRCSYLNAEESAG
jgi:hypothetical protein